MSSAAAAFLDRHRCLVRPQLHPHRWRRGRRRLEIAPALGRLRARGRPAAGSTTRGEGHMRPSQQQQGGRERAQSGISVTEWGCPLHEMQVLLRRQPHSDRSVMPGPSDRAEAPLRKCCEPSRFRRHFISPGHIGATGAGRGARDRLGAKQRRVLRRDARRKAFLDGVVSLDRKRGLLCDHVSLCLNAAKVSHFWNPPPSDCIGGAGQADSRC